jgi:bacterioferritin
MSTQDDEVVAALNTMLTIELTVINQYFLHSKLCAHWGYQRLAVAFRDISMEEMRDAESYTDRILELDGLPNFQRLGSVRIGETVTEQLTLARDAEAAALAALHQGILTSEANGDMSTAGMFRAASLEERQHLAWAQTQLRLIDTLGENDYLTTQVTA